MFAPRSKTVTRSVAIIPPLELWPRIQRIRILHEHKSVRRWPPHINLLYPFLETISDAELEQLNFAIQQFGACDFEICLNQLDVFKHGFSSTLVLVPDRKSRLELERLWNCLAKEFPECAVLQHGIFRPHLSIGNFKSDEVLQTVVDNLKDSFHENPLVWKLSTICVLGRRDKNDVLGESPFRMLAKIRFENGYSKIFNYNLQFNRVPNVDYEFSNDSIPCEYELDSNFLELVNPDYPSANMFKKSKCFKYNPDFMFWTPTCKKLDLNADLEKISILTWNVLSENIVKNELDSLNFASFDQR
jgi:hypothetical protein